MSANDTLAPWHRSGLALVALTCAAFWIGHTSSAQLAAGTATLAIAYCKGRLVILDFMELRGAPAPWRMLFEGWLIVVCAVLLGAYLYTARLDSLAV